MTAMNGMNESPIHIKRKGIYKELTVTLVKGLTILRLTVCLSAV